MGRREIRHGGSGIHKAYGTVSQNIFENNLVVTNQHKQIKMIKNTYFIENKCDE